MLYRTSCGCEKEIGMSKSREPHFCEHANLYEYVKQLGSEPKKAKPRKPLKQGQGLSASPEQRRKVKELACIVCGRDRFEVKITAMHVYPRRFATCSCADGVVPGCAECHDLYEAKKLDLLPKLTGNGYRKELVHAIVEHDAPPIHVLEIVTGVNWEPKGEA